MIEAASLHDPLILLFIGALKDYFAPLHDSENITNIRLLFASLAGLILESRRLALPPLQNSHK